MEGWNDDGDVNDVENDIIVKVMKRRMQTAEKKGEEETKTEFNPMYVIKTLIALLLVVW